MEPNRVTAYAIRDGHEIAIESEDIKLVLPNGISITVYLETSPDGYMSMMIPPTTGIFQIRPGAANHLMLSAKDRGNEPSQTPAAD
ncbi:hypothetical protein ACFRJ9_21645 [Paenarthrobacter sp. NPDC056912]|uniref:hypothetical protein n=1 Tax=Paenarthrobacter sp. NPDC056912 TaxID=3345965 RepID=UPI00366F5A48